jgi:hypothetical protein
MQAVHRKEGDTAPDADEQRANLQLHSGIIFSPFSVMSKTVSRNFIYLLRILKI